MAIMHRVKLLPDNLELLVEDGNVLLESLIRHSIFLRVECGGEGKCGKCEVQIEDENGQLQIKKACRVKVQSDMVVSLPPVSQRLSSFLNTSSASLPSSFLKFAKEHSDGLKYGIAVDLGTTTIAIYLCSCAERKIIGEVQVRNPQAPYGADVMSRIGAVAAGSSVLKKFSTMLVSVIEQGGMELASTYDVSLAALEKMVVVGNPAMIHMLLGIDPQSIGVAPYLPSFYTARHTDSEKLGFENLFLPIFTLPQVAGFIGGDIIAASMAAEIEKQPPGTMLIDIGTNGEILLKGKKMYYATSCATGPAFEGASISSGIQAVPGAIDQVRIAERNSPPQYRLIGEKKGKNNYTPLGLCGSGVISAVAELCRQRIVDRKGNFTRDTDVKWLRRYRNNERHYILWQDNSSIQGRSITVSQKDIRSIQLGKGALITGIEYLLKEAGYTAPKRIIVAGAFGSFLEKEDMLSIGLVPRIAAECIQMGGNLAGAGAVMALCDKQVLEQATSLAEKIKVINLAESEGFQLRFVENLYFPRQAVAS